MPLVADLFLVCYERDFVKSSQRKNGIKCSTSNSDNIHFEQMVHRIYFAEFQLNKANASDTEEAILDLNLSINNDTQFLQKYMINGMILI